MEERMPFLKDLPGWARVTWLGMKPTPQQRCHSEMSRLDQSFLNGLADGIGIALGVPVSYSTESSLS